MNIEPIKAFTDNYIWAIVNETNKSLWVVDPGEAKPVIDYSAKHNLNLSGILITHHHYDHCGAVAELRQKYTVPVYGPKHSDILATHVVVDKQKIFLPECDLSFEVLAIPGHTLEHIAYYCAEKHLLFCGDTLFSAGCGRVFEGTQQQMVDSLQILASLPDDTLVYCAYEYTLKNLQFAQLVEPQNENITRQLTFVHSLEHKPSVPTTLALEKKMNPFLRTHVATVIAAAEAQVGKPLNEAVNVFSVLREWKNNF
jgi:hydroxyacylglutathione hydrolase